MIIDQQLSKCMVITNYRTGSTSFTEENSRAQALYNRYEFINNAPSLQSIENILKKSGRFLFKLMPDQIGYNSDIIKRLKVYCNEIIYLYRKDYKQQVKSWIAWNESGDHAYHYGNKFKTYNIDVSQKDADKYADTIYKNNEALKEFYDLYPGSVYAYEDIHDNNPYTRQYNWKTMPTIKNYNTKEMFND
jgi:hypothetical protein